MSKTIVDMPKVAQMLDAGWHVRLFKGGMGSYEVRASHASEKRMAEIIDKLVETAGNDHVVFEGATLRETVIECHTDDGWLMTDDFTPEQALTRMSYKVFGEIL